MGGLISPRGEGGARSAWEERRDAQGVETAVTEVVDGCHCVLCGVCVQRRDESAREAREVRSNTTEFVI